MRLARDDIILRNYIELYVCFLGKNGGTMAMDQKGWFNVWREFKVWYGKLTKEGKAPTWRKQQRQIHDLVMKQLTPPVPVTGATNAPVKRGPGRPRKVPMAEAVMAATAAPGPSAPEAAPTPGAHN